MTTESIPNYHIPDAYISVDPVSGFARMTLREYVLDRPDGEERLFVCAECGALVSSYFASRARHAAWHRELNLLA